MPAYLWKVFLVVPLETGVNVSWKGQNAEIAHIKKRGDDEKAALINYYYYMKCWIMHERKRNSCFKKTLFFIIFFTNVDISKKWWKRGRGFSLHISPHSLYFKFILICPPSYLYVQTQLKDHFSFSFNFFLLYITHWFRST